LFFGSEAAGTRNAVVFTLMQNCRMHGVNPYEYFNLKTAVEATTPARAGAFRSRWGRTSEHRQARR
jgi:hypothetical protein